MARTRKIDMSVDENIEIMEEPVKIPADVPETQPESKKEEGICRICDNPYLTEVQKSVLVDYELGKILEKVRIEVDPAGKWTLLKYSSPTKYMYYLVNAVGANVRDAWQFYEDNVKDASIKGFLGIMSRTLGTRLEYRELELIDMD